LPETLFSSRRWFYFIPAQAKDAVGDGVAMMVIAEEPAIDGTGTQFFLYLFDCKHGDFSR
jgi:hypothetical protein